VAQVKAQISRVYLSRLNNPLKAQYETSEHPHLGL
jgi:hypothetical protein